MQALTLVTLSMLCRNISVYILKMCFVYRKTEQYDRTVIKIIFFTILLNNVVWRLGFPQYNWVCLYLQTQNRAASWERSLRRGASRHCFSSHSSCNNRRAWARRKMAPSRGSQSQPCYSGVGTSCRSLWPTRDSVGSVRSQGKEPCYVLPLWLILKVQSPNLF